MASRRRTNSGGADGAEELRFDFAEPTPATELPADPAPVPAPAAPQLSVVTAPPATTERDLDAPRPDDEPFPVAAPAPLGGGSDQALSVAGFYERLKSAVRAVFPDEVWVTGEIRKCNESRGHRYLELADHGASEGRAGGGRGAAAALEVACWARDWPPIAHELGAVGVELTAGMVVRVRGKVSIWEGGSKIRFSMTALDVEALVGGIAAARRRLLLALEAEDLLEANRRLPVPLVPLRVGLVTSPGSEAYRDFTGQLARSGYAFEVRLEPSLVQGADAPEQIAQAIERLASFGADLVVVVRGGGAKGDLAAFDHERVARAIATCASPVWTGIGHTGDRSVADEVAQRALVTPTQCGEEVVAAVAAYLDGVDRRTQRICRLVTTGLDGAVQANRLAGSAAARAARHGLEGRALALRRSEASIAHGALLAIERARGQLVGRGRAVAGPVRGGLGTAERQAGHRRQLLASYDPRRQLERGWSLTRRRDGRVVRSAGELSVGDELATTFADGTASSVVDAVAVAPPGASFDGDAAPPAGGHEQGAT